MITHRLEIDSARCTIRQRPILRDIYLRLETREVVTLLGLNGSGKSTLLQMLFGTHRGDYRHIRLDDIPQSHPCQCHGAVRYAPQGNFIPGFLSTARAFADYGIEIAPFLRHFPEYEPLVKYPLRQLSGGERQLVETYLVIKSARLFSLLDEPFAQLSPLHARQLAAIIRSEATQHGKGILLTDHRCRESLAISDRAYLLRDGNLTEIPSVSEFTAQLIDNIGILGSDPSVRHK